MPKSRGAPTAVEPTKVWEPPSSTPDRHGNYARRVLGTIKHKGFAVLDVTFGGQTVTTSPDHLFWSASREAWVPVGSMRPGELLRSVEGSVTPVEAISSPRHGFIELYNMEVEELHTYFVGASGTGSALVHNGRGN
jgi:Pretoxin HINT domain